MYIHKSYTSVHNIYENVNDYYLCVNLLIRPYIFTYYFYINVDTTTLNYCVSISMATFIHYVFFFFLNSSDSVGLLVFTGEKNVYSFCAEFH